MALTLRQLEIFLAAAHEQHFGRAAERLLLSQPAVSKEVRNLERTLRTTLFVRSPKGSALTEAGHRLAGRATEILDLVRELETSLRDPDGQPAEVVTVAGSPSVVDGFLPRALSRAGGDLPAVALHALEVETGDVARAVADERADLGLGHFVPADDGLERLAIGGDAVVGVIRADHPAAQGDTLDLADVDDLPLLIWPREVNPAYHDFLLSVCASMGPRPHTVTAAPRVMGAHSYLLTEGRAFALFPEQTAARLAPGLTALPLRRGATLPLDLVWRARDGSRPAVVAVRQFLRGLAADRADSRHGRS